MAEIIDTLRERGFVQQISDEPGLESALGQGPITLYWGTDPTADSLTAGHLVSLMMLAHFERAGHRPIVVVGGGTGLIGDPTGKTEMRQMLTSEQIDANMAGQRLQIGRFLDAPLMNNADWLLSLGYIEFLRDIGRHFSVNQLLQHSTYRERLAGDGLNFIELNYALMQAYDFLYLYRTEGCTLQVAGSDQWFNILEGTELIRRAEGAEAYALVTPLLTTATGQKMGKTAAGAVWLDPERTSPYDFYQHWINTADADVERFLAFFTFLPMDEVRALGRLEGADLRSAKEMLAGEVTKIVHGDVAAHEARETSQALFGDGSDLAGAPTTEMDPTRLETGLELVDLLTETGLVASKRAARDLIRQGGAYVNGQRVDDPGTVLTLDQFKSDVLLLRAGKKRFHRVLLRRVL
ncbi:MAG: tyrosine--tRNA ligase [Chloroflexi bacterium]|nr:tyrosine--tRNA ligase [Chloroflexota bacterium]